VALADKPAVPFRVPAGIKLIRVDARTGQRAGPESGGKVILEAFKPGTAPPDNYSVVGYTDQQQQPQADGGGGLFSASPDAERAVRRGTGLY
jgi:penicillin-binding protein 1A